ncbi:MAG: glycosyltransferase [Gemmataceae bacterium]
MTRPLVDELTEEYRGYRLWAVHCAVFALPAHLDHEELRGRGWLESHPEVFSGPSFDDVRREIDRRGPYEPPQPLGEHRGFRLLRRGERYLAVPPEVPALDHDDPNGERVALSAGSVEALHRRVDEAADATGVEFAGWFPIYTLSGDCGRHPQFRHTARPPAGYRFTHSGPAERLPRPTLLGSVGKWAVKAALAVAAALRPVVVFFLPCPGASVSGRLHLLASMWRLAWAAVRNGAWPLDVLCFFRTRNFRSQLMMPRSDRLVFLTSMPYTYGQWDWVLEIEDPTTLFYPLIHNGLTAQVELRRCRYFPLVKALLEQDACKAVVTHMRSTARLVADLFQSEIIARKIRYAPMGVALPRRWQRHEPRPADEPVELLFTDSWCQVNFFTRGGLEVLEAFAVLAERYPQLRLTVRAKIPPGLADRYHRVLEGDRVRVIARFLPDDEHADLFARSHIYLLPAARIHIVSLLQAMGNGLAVVGSDGWGFSEYVDHGRNGLLVEGRYGKASWVDDDAAMLREDYLTFRLPDPAVVAGIVEAVTELVEDPEARARLGRAARADVEGRYTVERWNAALKGVFDEATLSSRAAHEAPREVSGRRDRDEPATAYSGGPERPPACAAPTESGGRRA